MKTVSIKHLNEPAIELELDPKAGLKDMHGKLPLEVFDKIDEDIEDGEYSGAINNEWFWEILGLEPTDAESDVEVPG